MKRKIKLSVFVLSLIIAVAGCIPAAAETSKAEHCITEIIDYNLKTTSSASVQAWIDGYLTENAGLGAEWYAIALSRQGNYDFKSYTKALNGFLSENEVNSASSRLKMALVLIATGDRSSPHIKKLTDGSVGEQGIMSLVFGLHIINNGYSCDGYSADKLTQELLALQLADGGWSLRGGNGDADVTAMTLQALAPQYRSNGKVKSAVDKGLSFLSARQNDDGTFSSYGVSNPESISQVIIALSSLGIDAGKDKRFIKNSITLFDALAGFRLKDSSYCHQKGKESNSTATVQVFCAAVAFENMKKSESPFYIFEKKSTVTPTDKKEDNKTEDNKTDSEETTPSTEKTVAEKVSAADKTEKTSELITDALATKTEAEAQTPAEDNGVKAEGSRRLWVIIALSFLLLCTCAGLVIAKKRKLNGLVIALCVAVAVIGFVLLCSLMPAKIRNNYPDKNEITGTVTISITCNTVKAKGDELIPEDGIILEEKAFPIDADDTVYDILVQACKENNIHFETSGADDLLYIEGIYNIYEKDYGDLSGWMYFVNGTSPSVGCGNYSLSDKDKIEWKYTCNLGEDLGLSY